MYRLLTVLLLLSPLASFSQIKSDVVHWKFSVQKKGNNTWGLQATATMDAGFHIFALDPGGDGTMIPTAFTVTAPKDLQWTGAWQESKKAIAHTFEDLDMTVNYHEQTITFNRTFKAKPGVTVTGEVEYQSCNDKMCFPPTTKTFSLKLQ